MDKNENAKEAEKRKGKIREITQEMIKTKKKIEEEKKYNGPIQKLEFLARSWRKEQPLLSEVAWKGSRAVPIFTIKCSFMWLERICRGPSNKAARNEAAEEVFKLTSVACKKEEAVLK